MTASPTKTSPSDETITISKVENSLKKPDIVEDHNSFQNFPNNKDTHMKPGFIDDVKLSRFSTNNQDRFFQRNNVKEDSSVKPYDFNAMSETDVTDTEEEEVIDEYVEDYNAKSRSMLELLYEIADIQKNDDNDKSKYKTLDRSASNSDIYSPQTLKNAHNKSVFDPVNNNDHQETELAEEESEEELIEEEKGDDIIPIYLHIPKVEGCPKFCISINVEVTRAGRKIQPKCRKSLLCNNTKF